MIKEMHIDEYPITLKNMKSPPQKLYIRGSLSDSKDRKYLCIVGSRRWTSYGKEAVNTIVSGLKGYPVSIVSGLAYGIDSFSHIAALEAGLHCVGFPGSSLEWGELYPPEHLELAQKIVDSGGALISAWETGYPIGKWAFPARNRLMAGLSHAVLIIEAGKKSGSLMTAQHAEKFDRDVMAVPGSIESPQSYGPHMLIRRGAALVTSSYDVLEALGFEVQRPINGRSRKKRILPLHITDDALSMKILEALSRGPVKVDSLIEMTSAQVSSLNERLSMLELDGLIQIIGTTVKLI